MKVVCPVCQGRVEVKPAASSEVEYVLCQDHGSDEIGDDLLAEMRRLVAESRDVYEAGYQASLRLRELMAEHAEALFARLERVEAQLARTERGIVKNAGRLSPERGYRWSHVANAVGCGKTTAKDLCFKHDADPDELVGGAW